MVNSIFFLAFALSLDAFGVSLGLGCGKKLNIKEKSSIIFSFGFFQFFFVFSGGIFGYFINSHFFNISGLFSGTIVILLGVTFIKEGLENEEGCFTYQLNFWKYIMLGISVSIDALGAGFSLLYQYEMKVLTVNSLIVGIVTWIITGCSLILVNYIRNFKLAEKYSAYIGGIILIFIGLRMVFF